MNYNLLSTTPTADEIRNIPKLKEKKIAKGLVEYFEGEKSELRKSKK